MEDCLHRDCFNTALRLLTRRDHSCAELSMKLLRRGFESKPIQAVIKECLRLNYLNDEKFAHALTQQLERKGYGPRHIDRTLRMKGIPPKLIDDSLDRYCHETAQADNCRKALDKKLKTIGQHGNSKKINERLQRFLLGRGFSFPVIRRALLDAQVNEDGTDRGATG